MDWNWFYSSLAQTTGAIVGIFAAFIITKIINLQTEFSRKQARMKELLVISDNFRDELKKRRWKWYCNLKVEREMLKVDRLLRDGEHLSPADFVRAVKFPKFVPHDELVALVSERIDGFEAMRSETGVHAYVQSLEHAREDTVEDDDSKTLLKNEKNQIDALVLKTRQHIRRVKLHLGEIGVNREEIALVRNSIVVAGLLFLFGVVLPLSILRVENGTGDLPGVAEWFRALASFKGALLALVTGIFLYILGVFWRVLDRMRFDAADIATLRSDTDLTTYSPYLKARAENKLKQRTWFDERKVSKIGSNGVN